MCWGEGVSMGPPRLTSEPQCKNFCSSVTSQVVGKMPKISTFSGIPSRRERSHLSSSCLR